MICIENQASFRNFRDLSAIVIELVRMRSLGGQLESNLELDCLGVGRMRCLKCLLPIRDFLGKVFVRTVVLKILLSVVFEGVLNSAIKLIKRH